MLQIMQDGDEEDQPDSTQAAHRLTDAVSVEGIQLQQCSSPGTNHALLQFQADGMSASAGSLQSCSTSLGSQSSVQILAA